MTWTLFLVLSLGTASFAGGVAAQTTTDCYNWGGGVHCQTSAPPAAAPGINFQPPTTPWAVPDVMGSYARGYQLGIQIREERERAAAERAAQEQAQAAAQANLQENARQWRESEAAKARAIDAGNLIAAGHCDQARTDALQAGDLDLAAHVAALCPAAPPQ